MVQRTRAVNTFFQILKKIGLFLIVLIVAALTAAPFYEINQDIFNYQRPSGFFGFSLTDWFLAWTLASVFWAGVVFGSIGKRMDYIIILGIFLIGMWEYNSADNLQPQMYLGLIVATIVGTIIGYILKLLRQKYWK